MTKIALVIIPLIALFSTSAVRAEAPAENKEAKKDAKVAAPATESKEATKEAAAPVAEAKVATDETKTEAKAVEPATAEKVAPRDTAVADAPKGSQKTEVAAEKK